MEEFGRPFLTVSNKAPGSQLSGHRRCRNPWQHANRRPNRHCVHIPPQVFAALPPGTLDAATQARVAPLLEKAALTAAIDDACLLIVTRTGITSLCLQFARGGIPAPENNLQFR